MEIPKLNTTYNYFDDGKINPSRKYEVEITGISKFDDVVDKDYLAEWQTEVEQCDWLYNPITDYFVNGYIHGLNAEVTFVRCKNNGWFSFGLESGRLDIDGSLTAKTYR